MIHSALELPPLTADEAAHTAAVEALIRREILAAGGWIPFSRYMQLALYAPGLGYYSAGAQKFGPAGDFVTAPELTPLFAGCLARQLEELQAALGGGEVLEFGAGSGVLAADVLLALRARGALPQRYRILEVSAELRARQRGLLAERAPEVLDCVEWIESLPAADWQGVILANEVVDALPVERFRVEEQGVFEMGVTASEAGLAWQDRAAAGTTLETLRRIESDLPEPLAPGFEGELRTWDRAWLAGAAERLARGALLLIDYGLPRRQFYHPTQAAGTLRCYFRHLQHSHPLLYPGLSDITASVDFTELADAGVDAGLAVAGFSTQAHFLMSLDLERELADCTARLDVRGRAALGHAVGTLLLPGEMGERFRVLGLTRGIDEPLRGFAWRDLAATL